MCDREAASDVEVSTSLAHAIGKPQRYCLKQGERVCVCVCSIVEQFMKYGDIE